jgi:hypothetical protein
MRNDDRKFEPSASDDPLGQQLRREAMAERPGFSPRLHDRFVAGLRSGRQIAPWQGYLPKLAAIAAAILLIVFVLAEVRTKKVISTVDKSISSPVLNPPVIALVKQPPLAQFVMPQLTVRVPGLFTETLWPPRIALDLQHAQAPSESATADTDEATPTHLPDWIVAQLNRMAGDCTTPIQQVIPPAWRTMLGQ